MPPECGGLSFVYAKRFLTGLRIAPAALTTYQMGLALLLLAMTTEVEGIDAVLADPVALVALVLGLGLLGTGVAYILYYVIRREARCRHRLQRDLHPTRGRTRHRRATGGRTPPDQRRPRRRAHPARRHHRPPRRTHTRRLRA